MSQKDLFVAELMGTLKGMVSEDIKVVSIDEITSIPDAHPISQSIIGDYNANTSIYGDADALTAFAVAYAKFEIDDEIKGEIIADFLNLNNGRFAVSLSDALSLESSLSVPDFSGLQDFEYNAVTYSIGVEFAFGIIYFVLSET